MAAPRGGLPTPAILALPAPCYRIKGTDDGLAVQILRGVIQVSGEGVMQSAHRLRGIARPPLGKVEPVPVVDQDPQRETVANAPCALGCRRLLALDRWVHGPWPRRP